MSEDQKDIPSLKPSRMNNAFISRRSVRELPSISGEHKDRLMDDGGALVLLKPLDAAGGLLATVEHINAGSPDLTNQTRLGLIHGAALELASFVMGYGNPVDVLDADGELWQRRFELEGTYIEDLLADREFVAPTDKRYATNGEPAVKSLYNKIELALSLNPSERADYIKNQATIIAKHNLIGANDSTGNTYNELINKRVPKEEAYLKDAISRNQQSHAEKGQTYIDSPR